MPVDKQESCLQGKVLMGTSHSWWLFCALLSNADVIPGRPPRAVFVVFFLGGFAVGSGSILLEAFPRQTGLLC